MEVQQEPRAAPPGESRAGFVAWVEPHWELLRRVAWRFARPGDAEDVVQSALLAAWRHRARFDESRGSSVAWLTTITLNEARKSHRWRGRFEVVPPAGLSVEVSVDVRQAIALLPKRQRLAVELHYYVGLPVREVAAVMGCAEGTVKSTLAAARTALASRLGEDYL